MKGETMKRARNRSVPLLIAVIVALITITFLIETAATMPAFARKYSMSCTTCHAPFPRLKPYGDDFAGDGFNLKDKEAPRYFVDAGDQKLTLLRDIPFGIRFEGYAGYHEVTGKNIDFTSPYVLKLMSGGALSKQISYYFYFFFSERGEVAGIEDAFLMFNNVGGSELDLYVGQFQASDPLFKRELRLTYDDYLVYKTAPGLSSITLAYDRGIMATYGFSSGTDVVFELLNGNGIGAADENKVYDNDKYKTVLGRVSQDLGSVLRIGGVGYYGKEGDTAVNEVWMVGPDLTIATPKLTFNAQYVERRDTDPEFIRWSGDKIASRGGFGELVFMPKGDRSPWYAVALYNRVESDLEPEPVETITGHVGHVLRTNFRLTAEFTYDISAEESRFLLGFVSGF
jgi:hypothetical protein